MMNYILFFILQFIVKHQIVRCADEIISCQYFYANNITFYHIYCKSKELVRTVNMIEKCGFKNMVMEGITFTTSK